LLAGGFLSIQVTRPLRAFAREMERVGVLDIPAEPSPDSPVAEIHQMGQVLDRMKASLGSFEKYVPADLVRLLVRTGKEARLGGETARLTLFFADVVDFTAASERLEPTELVAALADYLEELEGIIGRHEGIVDKYIGDSIMAIWGAPIKPDPHPEVRACAAALEISERLATMRDQHAKEGRVGFEARIGIHTGDAMIGNIGSQRRMNYTAMGDAVNVASRVEALNRFYGTRILVGESTREAAGEAFEFRLIDCVAVKGRQAGIRIHELLSRHGMLSKSEEQLRRAYEQGLECYRQRHWEAAATAFRTCLALVPGDRPAQVLLARCEGFATAPPPADWDGVFLMTTKVGPV